MQLSVREVAEILGVSQKTVYRWIQKEQIPGYRIGDQYRFNRAELLEWATQRRMSVRPEVSVEPEAGEDPLPTLIEALRAGGIQYRIGGSDKASVLRAVVENMRLTDEVDRDFLHSVLLAREALGSTGIGDGIAIPHMRNPVLLHLGMPSISVSFLEEPVDFAALDGKPIHTLFTLVSPTVTVHLHLLSCLSFALRHEGFRSAILRQAPREEIFAAAEEAVRDIVPPRGGAA
jgi:PTS system nitrogen regulatory IIA component